VPRATPKTLWIDILLAFVIASLALGYKHEFNVEVFDEGLTLYGSLRVANGDVPYRDFWTTYGPGSYYLVASAFHLFGATVSVLRKLWLFFETLVAVEALILARMLGGRGSGWLAFGLAIAVTIHANLHSGYSVVPALAAALGALIFSVLHRAPYRAGILVGITAVFRHDFGVYVACVIAAGLAVSAILTEQSIGRDLLRFSGAVAVVALPAYGALALAAGIPAIVEQLIIFPGFVLAAYYALPLSWSVNGRWLLVPGFALCVGGAFVAIETARDRLRLRNTQVFGAMLLCLLTFGLLNYARVRLDHYHIWPMTIATIPLIAMAPAIRMSPERRRKLTVIVTGILIVYAGLAVRTVTAKATVPVVALATPRGSGITIPKADAAYNDLVLAIKARTQPGEPIFSGATRHDRLFGNDLLLYFLADRPAATPFYELNRALMAHEAVQTAIIEALERRAVRVVVLFGLLSNEANLSSSGRPVPLLDDYIRLHYTRVGTFGDYELRERNRG
jgi:hypothetical protein